MLRNRLKKIEKTAKERKRASESGVFLASADEEENVMKIKGLGFVGTIEEGYALMDQYPDAVFIVDNIPDLRDEDEWENTR